MTQKQIYGQTENTDTCRQTDKQTNRQTHIKGPSWQWLSKINQV